METQNLADVIAKLAQLQNGTLESVYNSKIRNLSVKLDPDKEEKVNILILIYWQFKALIKIMDEIRLNETLRTSTIQFDTKAISEAVNKDITEFHEQLKNKQNDSK